MKLRDLFTEETKSVWEFDEVQDDKSLFNFDFDLLKLKYENFGGSKYKIYEYREDFYVILETVNEHKLISVISVYEYHGHEMFEDKELFLVHGHESIILFFGNGDYKRIHTR